MPPCSTSCGGRRTTGPTPSRSSFPTYQERCRGRPTAPVRRSPSRADSPVPPGSPDTVPPMGGSSFGQQFRITTFGESHGTGLGVVVDGCPPRLEIALEEIQHDLDRRRPGQSRLTTQRQEGDVAEVLSGVFEGLTLGTPIAILIRNADALPGSYEAMKDVFRPSHA